MKGPSFLVNTPCIFANFKAMDYQQTLDYLYSNLPMFSRSGAEAYKKDVTNTVLLCAAVGNPQNEIKTVHIAGTNGKGSVSHMLAAIFQQHGYKTGLYTSPHLKDFRERMKINGKMAPEDFIVSFVSGIKETSEAIRPSFFELTVAMVLAWFAAEKVDIAVIETGLGGRLDSTNIIKPELSVITNIGYDHMNILGNTLEEIAFEKAGIIKQNTPVVIGETLPQTRPVFSGVAAACTSEIVYAEEKFTIHGYDLQTDMLDVVLKDSDSGQIKTYSLDLNGIYQKNNLRTVVTAVDVLARAGYALSGEKVATALRQVKHLNGLHGRWEVIQKEPVVVLDVAHNEDGIKQLLTQLSLLTFKDLHIVFGMVRDKEADKILSLLPHEAVYYFTQAQIPRALPVEELVAKAEAHSLHGCGYANVSMALSCALENAGPQDMIIVCGSVYLVGEVGQIFKEQRINS